ncbi:hypothetical protein [Paenibacillus sp. NEAU-GSW1]|uniref:hypothetical protein n=1 Tax=Paenibacillus sp. NEAU-GSW1 TaxID=2682486 RepID=UPI0012E2FB86|nr:hypothetical protein [Paenibacillus sp. NEAU-GSW1]MUT67816.1 hypothetical protein [Paenibacillus sp. NEAU-GSW1]
MISWKRKLASRKFWALVSAVATSVIVLVGAGEEAAVKITGLISAVGSVAVYILAEAHVDAKRSAEEEVVAADAEA